jgi:hypothetical protein
VHRYLWRLEQFGDSVPPRHLANGSAFEAKMIPSPALAVTLKKQHAGTAIGFLDCPLELFFQYFDASCPLMGSYMLYSQLSKLRA